MVLEIWFDYLCPQSYFLQTSLVEAVKQYTSDHVEIRYRSYEMLPGLKNGMELTLCDVISKHLITDEVEIEAYFKDKKELLNLTPYEVHDAHRLGHLAKIYDVSTPFHTMIFNDYYTHHKDISNHDYLRKVALNCGMPKDKIDAVLQSDLYHQQVTSNRENAILKGIHRIPHIRINGKQPMYGMQTVNQLLTAFDYANHIEKKFYMCLDDSCEVNQ
jgi:predicted DsbA family dithiol-disulfide isomerase